MVILMDEMHIRESLVYDKVSGMHAQGLILKCVCTGVLVGFTDLGQIDTHLFPFQ